jgi:hypothetical protein
MLAGPAPSLGAKGNKCSPKAFLGNSLSETIQFDERS